MFFFSVGISKTVREAADFIFEERNSFLQLVHAMSIAYTIGMLNDFPEYR